MNLTDLLHYLPHTVKQPLKYLYGIVPEPWRLGKTFRETYDFLQKSQWWNKEKLEEYQMQQLSKILHHAYENVPYYRNVFNERGITPEDIQNFDDLRKLPYLTKEIIRDNLHDLTARNYPKSSLEYVTTGGSTGIPLGFYYEKGISRAKEWAFMLTQWNRAGFTVGDKRVILRGNVVKSRNNNKFWQYNPIEKALILSSYHMTDEIMHQYINTIRKFRPQFFHVYPSVITILAKFMKSNNIKPFAGLKAILCGSENIYTWQRELLEEVFQCRVYSWYGHTELCVLAGECEKSSHYHIAPEYGFMELIKNDGTPLIDENALGEIVGTGFINYTTPFIRYKTKDLAIYINKICPCGRANPLIKGIEGREQEYIVTKNSNLISLNTAIFSIHEKEWANVKKIQFLQEEKGELVIFIVPMALSIPSELTEYVLNLFQQKLGGEFKLEIRMVDEISLTSLGKNNILIQKLPIKLGY